MAIAVERIGQAITRGEKIWVFGDSDVDGYTSTAVLVKTLKRLNARVAYYIPDRFKYGYGLHRFYLDEAKKTGANLIVTVDTGSRDWDGAQYARELGLDLIITDHHLVGDTLPEAIAVINPQKTNCAYPEKTLAGVGVAFKLACALLQRLGADESPAFLLPLVALGSIADRVPLLGENRILTQLGLEKIRTETDAAWLVLCYKRSINQKKVTAADLNEKAIGLFNAGKVMSGVHFCVDFFMTGNSEEAEWMLDQLNFDFERWETTRDQAWSKVITHIAELRDQNLVIFRHDDIPTAFIGLCASNLCKLLERPAVVIGEGGNAEGRAPQDCFNLLDLLNFCKAHLTNYGGHKPAAGCTIKPGQIEAFIAEARRFEAQFTDSTTFTPTIWIDSELTRTDLVPRLRRDLRKLEPYGQRNALPIFLLRNLKQLFLNLKIERDAIVGDDCIFNFDERAPKDLIFDALHTDQPVDVVGRYLPHPARDVFRFMIMDAKVATAAAADSPDR